MNKETLKIIQEKLNINDNRTAKQIVANKELCAEIIKREVISEGQLVEEYQIPKNHLKGLRQQNKLSFFTSIGEVDISSRGSKVYYFVDEVKDLFGYNIKYNKSQSFKNAVFNRLVVGIAKKLLTERQSQQLEMFLIKNMSIEEIADEFGISVVRTNDLITTAYKKVVYRVDQLDKMYEAWVDALSLRTEHDLLKEHNTALYNKFLRNKENQELKEFHSNAYIQHFINYGYDIKDLSKNFNEFDIYLSLRSRSGLERAGIENLEDLLCYRKRDLRIIRNMGTKSVNEICDWLEDNYNWTLK